MRLAIALTLLIAALVMGWLVTINVRDFRRDGRELSKRAAFVAGFIGFWLLIAAAWVGTQGN